MTYNIKLAVGIILYICFIVVIWPLHVWRYMLGLFLYLAQMFWLTTAKVTKFKVDKTIHFEIKRMKP